MDTINTTVKMKTIEYLITCWYTMLFWNT